MLIGKVESKAMKAIRVEEFGGPEVMKLVEVPQLRPGAGQVLVRMHAAGVNPVETYIRAGTYPRKPALPFTPGNDGAGVVEQVGEGASKLQPGDRVYTAGSISGTYAEYALCNAAQVHPLPANVSFAQGAAMGTPYATAYRGLFPAGAGEARRNGFRSWRQRRGRNGGGAARARARSARARHRGDRARARTGARTGRARGVRPSRAGLSGADNGSTSGRGVDVILEMLANVNLGKDLTILAPRGRVVVIGSRGRVEIDARDTMSRDADIRGMVLPNTPAAEMASIHAALVAGLENGTLRPVIGQELPLAEAPQAHRAVMEPGAFGKIVLKS